MKTLIGVVCGVAAVALFLIPTGSNPQPPTPNPKPTADVVEAFNTYERLWLDLNLKTAAKLDSKEFTTAQETWDYIASGQESARRIAFDKIATKEQSIIGDGKWTPELHSTILKGYSK